MEQVLRLLHGLETYKWDGWGKADILRTKYVAQTCAGSQYSPRQSESVIAFFWHCVSNWSHKNGIIAFCLISVHSLLFETLNNIALSVISFSSFYREKDIQCTIVVADDVADVALGQPQQQNFLHRLKSRLNTQNDSFRCTPFPAV